VLVFDSDEAGQAAVFKSIITCRKNGLACSVAAPGKAALPGNAENPPGNPDDTLGSKVKDPADILQKFGADTLNKSMKCDIIDIEYLVSRAKTLYDISTPRGKKGAISLFFPYFNALDSKTERDACIEAVADAIRADKGAILGDFERWQHSANGRSAASTRSPEKPDFEEVPDTEQPVRMNDELFLLMVVSVNTDLYPEFRASIGMREIEDPSAKELFIALEECFIKEESGTDALLSRIVSQRLKNFFIERGMSPEFRGDSKRNPGKMMEGGIRRVKGKRLRRRLTEISAELRLREKNSGVEEDDLQELIIEKMHIDAELRNLEGNN
jgi:DNA primase